MTHSHSTIRFSRSARLAATCIFTALFITSGCGSGIDDPSSDDSVPVVPAITEITSTPAETTTIAVDASPDTEPPVDTEAPASIMTVSTAPPTTTPHATAPPTTAPNATASPTTMGTAAPATTSADPTSPIANAYAVAATPDGVFVDWGTRSWDTKILDDTSEGLALIVDDLVVYQANEVDDILRLGGPIVVTDGQDRREFSDSERAVKLHDVGHVDGAAVMLVSSSVPMPVGPDDDEERMLLVNVDTFDVTDLGRFGGWEDTVLQGRFGDGAISLLRVRSADHLLQVVEHDGTVRHDVEVGFDSGFSLLDFDESVWVLEPSFTGEDFATPVLGIQQIDLATAEVREVSIELTGVEIPAGFCDRADFLDGRIVCDQSIGGPISLDPDAGTVGRADGLDEGRIMFPASQ